jgi:hypothetical protein
MKVIIAGGRDIEDYELVLRAVLNAGFDITAVVSGGAPGVDTMGERFAEEAGLPIYKFPAEWNKYRNAAGPIRNRLMAEFGDALIAIWDGKSTGTKNMIDQATQHGLKIHVEMVDALDTKRFSERY